MGDIDFLARKLHSGDAEERREATIDLGRSGREAAPLLFQALGDPDWRVRKTAVEALAALRGGDVIAGLIASLGAVDNAGKRNSAIEALVRIGTDAVDALLGAMSTPDDDVRKFIVDILGDIRDRRATSALIAGLDDQDENIRVAAAEALGKLKDKGAVDALIGCLTRYGQGWLDYAAAEALGEIGDERALAPLLYALGRSSLREPVLEALGKIGNADTIAPLIAGLADTLRIVREVSATALSAIYKKIPEEARRRMAATVREGISDRSVDFLEEMIITSAGEIQKSAVIALGWAGRKTSVQKLLSLLKEEEMEEPVVEALKSMDGRKAPLLIGSLADENGLVRRSVARVLGDIGCVEAEQGLIRLLSDENGHVRSAAAEALGRLRSGPAVRPLIGLLEDEYESVQESAIKALASISDESVLDDLLANFTSRTPSLRRNIVHLLGRFKTERARDALAFALKDPEPMVRRAVVRALDAMPVRQSVRSLLLAITDDDPEVRMLAAEALGMTDAPEAQDALITLLEDSDLWVRAAAVRGLGRIGGAKALEALTRHLDTATDIFLLSLVDAAGRLRIEQARDRLIRLSDHPDPEVRKTVLAALSSYSGTAVQHAVLSRLSDPHWSVRKAAIDILKNKKDPASEKLLARIAEEDPDGIVRQAAREALVS